MSKKVRSQKATAMMLGRLQPAVPWQLAGGVAVGLLVGVVSSLASPLWALALLGGGAFVGLALRRPEVGMLGIVFATSGVLLERRLPLVSVGVGSLHIPDLIFLGLFAMLGARLLAEREFRVVRTPADGLLLGFFACAAVATIAGVLTARIPAHEGLRETRVISYYLLFFAVTNLVRARRQLLLMTCGLLLLGALVALAVVGQSLLGSAVHVLPGRVETLVTTGRSYTAVTRVLPPGQSLIQLGAVTSVVLLALPGNRRAAAVGLVQVALFGLALTLTFSRGYWAGAALAAALAFLVVDGPSRRRLAGRAALLALAGGVALVVLMGSASSAGRLVTAAGDRAGTLVGGDVLRDPSLMWRSTEYRYALHQVWPPRLVGIGLGAAYRPWDSRLDSRVSEGGSGFDGRGYIHNGHLWLLLKAGMPAYLCFICMAAIVIGRGLVVGHRIADPLLRACAIAYALTALSALVGSMTSPMLMEWFWTPVLGLAFGAVEAAIRIGAEHVRGSHGEDCRGLYET